MITPKDILDVIKDVPGDEYMVQDFTNGVDKCCALGHYMRLTSDDPADYSPKNCFRTLVWHDLEWQLASDIMVINNTSKDIKGNIISFLTTGVKPATH